MRLLLLLGLLVLLSSSKGGKIKDHTFDPHRWEDRLIVLVAGPGYQKGAWLHQQQEKFIRAHGPMRERDMVVYMCRDTVCLKGAWTNTKGDHKWIPTEILSAKVREHWKVSENTVLLIGKDGGEKGRWTKAFDPAEVFQLVDQMPMRRAEQKQQEKTQ